MSRVRFPHTSVKRLARSKLLIGQRHNLWWAGSCFDALAPKFRELKLRKNARCPVCSAHREIHTLIDYNEFCGIRGAEEPEIDLKVPEITAGELKQRCNRGDEPFILNVREPHE